MLPLRAGVDLGATAMKMYSAFHEAPVLLEPPHRTVECHIQVLSCGNLTRLQRCSRLFLPTGPEVVEYCPYGAHKVIVHKALTNI